jgi:chromate transporter
MIVMDEAPTENQPAASDRPALGELAVLFLKLGTIAFGGPAAHIAMMEDEVVHRRRWLTHEHFLDMLGTTNLIPGPNSTEMAIHIGWQRAGLRGLLVAGSCFILPAMIIVSVIAWAYVRFGQLPAATAVLYGVKPVVIAIVVQALWRLGRVAVKTKLLAAIGILAATANLLGMNELIVLFGAAAVVAAIRAAARGRAGRSLTLPALAVPMPMATVAVGAAATATTAAAAGSVSLLPLFLVFLKIGSVLFGSGYVLLAFLRADFVQHLHWLTEAQLLDATAVGQVTPGPVFTTATFIGYLLAGPRGALVATLGIFLPAFVFVAASAPLIPRLRRSPTAGAVLDGLNVASLALMAVVTWQLGRAAVVDWPTLALAAASAVLLIRYRVNATWLVLGGGVLGAVAAL